MQTYNANYWEDYSSYVEKKKREAASRKKCKKRQSKKEKEKKIQAHNEAMNTSSKQFSEEMKLEPSELEKRMQQFLDNLSIQYDFQRVFNIKKKSGAIKQYYIADFYVPSKNLIIETDGKFHDQQVDKDELRTKIIQKHYPGIKILRWRWHDFESLIKLKELANAVK